MEKTFVGMLVFFLNMLIQRQYLRMYLFCSGAIYQSREPPGKNNADVLRQSTSFSTPENQLQELKIVQRKVVTFCFLVPVR